jgi:hypothetical protein
MVKPTVPAVTAVVFMKSRRETFFFSSAMIHLPKRCLE